jgi:hypothetical protein
MAYTVGIIENINEYKFLSNLSLNHYSEITAP